MALVARLKRQDLEKWSEHLPVECTYTVLVDHEGTRYLQLDTYGSELRQIRGKKSQSIRFTPAALAQLKTILRDF